MGLRKVLHALDGPTVLCYSMHVASAAAVPALTKLLITQIRFPYTATLALTQAVIIALCLWFWTIFGVFKVRVLPLRNVLPLAATGALQNVLQLLILKHGSLLHYEVARLLPLAATTTAWHATPLVLGSGLLLLLHPPPLRGLWLLSASVAATLVDRTSFMTSLRKKTRASELQLQLPVRSLMAAIMIPVVPLVDDYSSESAGSILEFQFDESATILIFSTGVAAFFAFVAVRASASRLSDTGFRGAALSAAMGVFVMHFVMCGHTVGVVDVAAVMVVLGGALHVSVVAERWRRAAMRAGPTLLPSHESHESRGSGESGGTATASATAARPEATVTMESEVELVGANSTVLAVLSSWS